MLRERQAFELFLKASSLEESCFPRIAWGFQQDLVQGYVVWLAEEEGRCTGVSAHPAADEQDLRTCSCFLLLIDHSETFSAWLGAFGHTPPPADGLYGEDGLLILAHWLSRE